MARGQSLATIESAKWVGPFPAVLSGVIVATNEAALEHVPLQALQSCAADVPDDPGDLLA